MQPNRILHATEKSIRFPLLLGVLPKERNCIYPCIKIRALQSHFGVHLLSPSYPTTS